MGVIRYQLADGVAEITIDRPEKRNAMTYSVLEEFLAAVDRAADDEGARVVVITGAGGAFCAGTDLSDLSDTPAEDRAGPSTDEGPDGLGRWAIVRCPKPVIAAVDGPAVGMGAEFTCQCDVRIASTRARFAWNFVHRGLVPDTGAGSWLLPRQIGLPAALRLLYSGEFLSAAEAYALGYVSRVVEPDQLPGAARELAAGFLAGSPTAARGVKNLVYRGLERGIDAHLRHSREVLQTCLRSDDHREGVAAFVERREPRFTGR
jgi:2-(1,2-epoxy-1,2-dihydrophenyl)acetyl-CoA isomerase